MPFEPWQAEILQQKGLADAQGDLVFEILNHLDDPDSQTHAVVRKITTNYEYFDGKTWTPDKKRAAVLTTEKANQLAAKLAKQGAKSVVFTEKIAPDVVDRLFAADTSPDHRWGAWIFEEAGGGQAARQMSERLLNYLQQRYIHQHDAASWASVQAAFQQQMSSGDEDVLHKMRGCFGYMRNWPGRENIYKTVAEAVTLFQQHEAALTELNQQAEQEGRETLPSLPQQFESVKRLTEINRRVSNWIAAKRVRTDKRVATWKNKKTIYNDDYVWAVAPLTYAAAVDYGFEGWDVADPEKFAKVAQGELQGNPWDQFLSHGNFMVFLSFNVPMPRWIGRDKGYKTYELGDLLIPLSREVAAQSPDEWEVIDQENDTKLTIHQIKEIIMREGRAEPPPTPRADPQPQQAWRRAADPHPLLNPAYAAKEADWPIKRGAQAVPSEQEAQAIVSHLDACLQQVQAWALKFDPIKMARVVGGDED